MLLKPLTNQGSVDKAVDNVTENNNDVTINVTKKDNGVIENCTVNHVYPSYNIPKEQKR